MSQRREVALQLSGELGNALPEFQQTARLRETPADVGTRLRSALGVSDQEQRAWRNEWQAWRSWRAAVEKQGVLVFQFPKVDLQGVRGLTLPLFPGPVIGINSRELSAGARSFTLMHELVHLALARAHEENVALRESRKDSAWQQVERFAEEAASAVLIPQPMLEASLRQMSARPNVWDVPRVREPAAHFRVTPLATPTRLRAARQLTWTDYRRWKQERDRYLAQSPSRRGGLPPRWRKR